MDGGGKLEIPGCGKRKSQIAGGRGLVLIIDGNWDVPQIQVRRVAECHQLHERGQDHQKSQPWVAKDLEQFLAQENPHSEKKQVHIFSLFEKRFIARLRTRRA